MIYPRAILLPLLALLLAPPAHSAAASAAQTATAQTAKAQPKGGIQKLAWALPAAKQLKGFEALAKPDYALGDDLYRLINGGAGAFIKVGFIQAISRNYRNAEGVSYSVEVFDMGQWANAQKIFVQRGGTQHKKNKVSQGDTLEDYYGLFWQDRYFITITAFERTDKTRADLELLAQTVVANIKQKQSAKKTSKPASKK